MALSVEKKVGMFFLFGLIILGVLLEVGEKWNPFEKNVPYKTYLTSITGLKVGDPVRLAGVDVGRIKGINILNDKIEINFEVKPGTRIKSDTVAGLRLTNLLGGQFLGLSFGSPNASLLEPGGVVKGAGMTGKQRVLGLLAARYLDYARSHRLLADAQVAVAERFAFDCVSAISDPPGELPGPAAGLRRVEN
jgi:hypothetical protein